MKTLVLVAVMLTISLAQAGNTFVKNCDNLENCAKAAAAMTGKKYLFDKDAAKVELKATENLTIDADNIDTLFTMLLNVNGYTRVPVPGDTNTFQISRQRDARDANVPLVKVDESTPLPENNTYDLITMTYKLKNPEYAEDISRLLRSFLPANARVLPMMSIGAVVVTDQAQNQKKSYLLIKESDVAGVTVEARKGERKAHKSEKK